MSITLSKDQTINLYFDDNKLKSLNKRLKFRTYHKWWCLNCNKEIFVKYDTISFVNIFCKDKDCQEKAKHPTIIQAHYLKRLKEDQLRLFDNIK